MKNILRIILILSCFTPCLTFSQNIKRKLPYDAYVFVDKAYVRVKPQIDSKIQDELTIGQKVTVISVMDSSYFLNGIRHKWYNIKYSHENKENSGYIWGALLSQKYISLKDKMLLFGFSSYKADEGYVGVLKIFSKDKTLSKLSIKMNYIDNSSLEELPTVNFDFSDNLGYKSFQNIIRVKFSDVADYESNNRNIVAIVNDKLYYIGQEYFQGEGGVGSKSELFIFPNEKGGIPDYLLYKYVEYRFSENQNKDVLVKSIQKKYVWENSELVEKK